jgi:hypothetical protein
MHFPYVMLSAPLSVGKLEQIGSDHRLVGRIEWDPATNGRTPLLVIDGRPFTWDEVGKMLMTFEGFTLDARIEDTIELLESRPQRRADS